MSESITFILVGSGAVRVNANRGGTCQVLKAGGRTMLFDCGRSAVHNLVRFGVPIESVDDVFITHLHFDHVCDLAQLVLLSWNNGRAEPLNLYGPPGIAEFMEVAVRQGYQVDIASRLTHGGLKELRWNVVEIGRDGSFLELAGLQLHALATPHGHMPNLNFRIDAPGGVATAGSLSRLSPRSELPIPNPRVAESAPGPARRRIVITSDTQWDEKLVGFVRGADLMVVECSGTRAFLESVPWGSWHMTPEAIAELAEKAGVRQVVIKHLVVENWVDDPDVAAKMEAAIRAGFSGQVRAGYDGLTITL